MLECAKIDGSFAQSGVFDFRFGGTRRDGLFGSETRGTNVYSEKFEEYRIAGTRVRRKKMVTISAKKRTEDFGSAGSRRLIKQGLLPAEMYNKESNIHIVLNAHDFDLALRRLPLGAKCVVSVDGSEYNCVFKDLQENIMTDTLLHADFQIV